MAMANTNSMEDQPNVRETEQPTESLSSLFPLLQFRFTMIHSSMNKQSLCLLMGKVLFTHTIFISRIKFRSNENDFLIQIGLLFPRQSVSEVLLFFNNRLPSSNTDSFIYIKTLLEMIFHSHHQFYGWNFDKRYLDAFVRDGFLSQTRIDQIVIIDLQERFKQWYNPTFKHGQHCPVSLSSSSSVESQADDPACICRHRPYKKVTDQWCILKAIQYALRIRLRVPNPIPLSHRMIQCECLTRYQVMFQRLLMIVKSNLNLTQLNECRRLLNKQLN